MDCMTLFIQNKQMGSSAIIRKILSGKEKKGEKQTNIEQKAD